MDVSLFFGLFSLLSIVGFVIWILALVEVLRTPEDVWSAAGQDRLIWALVVIFLNVLGAIIYYVVARPSLAAHR